MSGYEQLNLGLRLHDARPGTLAERAAVAREMGYTCAHLALSKTIDKSYMEPAALTPGLADAVKGDLCGLSVSVLGCYLNLAHPDWDAYQQILRKYVAHLRFNTWLGAGMVGTETGSPNAAYAYDPETTHSDWALELFIRRLEPVVRAAEQFGVMMAIEPVYKHIVSTPRRARRVLDAIGSPNLGIILDPVNLLHPDNLDHRDEIVAEAIELLGEETLTIHLKDYRIDENGQMISIAAGTGEMDYSAVLRFAKARKPFIQMTLENTKPENCVQARKFLMELAENL